MDIEKESLSECLNYYFYSVPDIEQQKTLNIKRYLLYFIQNNMINSSTCFY